MNILFVGTIFDSKHNTITGQTVVSDIVLENLCKSNKIIRINTADSGKYQRGSFSFTVYRISQFIGIFLKLLYILLTKKVDRVYYQPATSKMGIARDYIAMHIIRLFSKPIILHLLGYITLDTLRNYGSTTWRRFSYVYNKSSKIIVEGEKMKSEFDCFDDYLNKIVVIPNGMNIGLNKEQPIKRYNNKVPFKLLYLSNFIYSKGYFDVLRALNILVNERHLNVECNFAGKFYSTLDSVDNDTIFGTEEAFKSYISNHKLNKRVKYQQGLFGDDKRQAFETANAFLLPTFYSAEGQPMSIIEAMYYGCVPIVTNQGHIPMMVNNHNGCIVESRNPKSIADAVERLMSDNKTYSLKSKISMEDFHNKFRGDVFGKKLRNVLLNNL